ncbi:TetR/AcrR family transcriptional regulator [Kineosporia rhizophila]|uniref:TetR/AcrR family transcriptional regulator n=1 Tax=Kineosporia TaxID=49184 RepID=UPI001E65B0F0|nr:MULTISPECIES: TetR/AcrR family transcriptional regulator [Kineosporia]MCE0533976.1 TetR/AcrR family transcriptional regulator [Kineosporia rhizophila]
MSEKGPVSRRERPSKPALSLETILDTAIALLDADGLDGVTMRRVAQQLDTGAASLYVYVRNREDLLTLVWDRIAGEIEVPGPESGDWRARLVQLVLNSIENLGRHRDLAMLGLAVVPLGPNSLQVSEAMVGILAESGLGRRAQVWAVDLLALYIVATAAENAARQREGSHEVAESQTILAGVAPQTFPHLHELRTEFAALGPETGARQRWMVEALVNGILATPTSEN